MNPSVRRAIRTVLTILVLLGGELLVFPVGKAYAQAHGFRSGSFRHLGRRSGAFHSGAGRPHWGVQQHGFSYGSGHAGNRREHSGFRFSPYYGGVYSWGSGSYPYPLHSYPPYLYSRGHRPRVHYVPRHHGFRYFRRWHPGSYYYPNH